MQNIKLTIEYDGSYFKGWQIQAKGERTVQGEIAATYQKVFKEKITLIGSGRTDTGVSALGQVANFKTTVSVHPTRILKALNANLPAEISITKAKKVNDDFHAQYSAREKTYRYTILNRETRSALYKGKALHYRYPVDLDLMRNEIKAILGKHDFKAFQTNNRSNHDKNTTRIITKATIQKRNDLITITLTSNGFLYKMVRNIVGTLLEIGSGKLKKGSMREILKKKNRIYAGTSASAEGLLLLNVKY